MKRGVGFVVVAVLALAGLIVLRPAPAPATGVAVGPEPETPEPAAEPPAAAPARIAVAAESRASPVLEFDAALERLVALGLQIRAAAERDDLAAATRFDQQARALVLELESAVADTDERALFALLASREDVTVPADQIRRDVCSVLIEQGLTRRHRESQHGGGRGRLDALVRSMLASVPQSERLADELGTHLLVDRPFLGLAHEDAVLDLVAQSTGLAFLNRVASALLLTLWHNLERDRVRSSNELTALALLFKDDRNPARRLAALRLLLESQDGRFRELVLDDVARTRDPALAREVATTVAQALAPRAALAALERLSPLLGHDAIAPFMLLGHREPALLREAYEAKLAANVEPALRAELVTGAGFVGGEQGVGIAQLAFEHDADPEVRARAVFALTAKAGAALGERTLHAALDDATLGNDPGRLGQLVLALENLARLGEANAVQRVGERLRLRARLLPADRQTLERILEQGVPK